MQADKFPFTEILACSCFCTDVIKETVTPCYHGNKDWCGMARTTERGRRGRKGRKSPPSVLCQQQKPRGNLVGETESQEFIPNFLTHTNRFVLQHQHWQVLLSFPLLSKSSAPLSYPPLLPFPCTLSTLQSLLVQPCLPLFSYSPLLLFHYFADVS